MALAAEGLPVVAGRAPNPTAVGIEKYDSQSGVDALVTFLKKRTRQHIRCALPWQCIGPRSWPLLDSRQRLAPASRRHDLDVPPMCPPARRIACPAFRLPGRLMERHKPLLMAAADALLPSPRFAGVIAARQARVVATAAAAFGQAEAREERYNLIHLRVEEDWVGLCEWWQNPAEGRDNCYNNTRTVGEQLRRHGFEQEVRAGQGRSERGGRAYLACLGSGCARSTADAPQHHRANNLLPALPCPPCPCLCSCRWWWSLPSPRPCPPSWRPRWPPSARTATPRCWATSWPRGPRRRRCRGSSTRWCAPLLLSPAAEMPGVLLLVTMS